MAESGDNLRGSATTSEIDSEGGLPIQIEIVDEEHGSVHEEGGEPAAAPERDTWGSTIAYLLTLVGYAVGFGNIWRFPFQVRENGGLVFLIPYCIMLALIGVPVFFLELAVGQRRRKGILHAWNEISPTLGGLGMCCGWICFMIGMYYNTLLAYCMSYLIDSFQSPLPWTKCKYVGTDKHQEECTDFLSSKPSKYYWYRETLGISKGIDDVGDYNWVLCGYLVVAWVLIWLILWKGTKLIGKVVYFTAVFPYVVLIIFFIANCVIDPRKGWTGAYRLLKPDWSFLLKPSTWLKAGSQIFFSLGLGQGCLVVFASYSPARNNCHKDAISISLINCGTSILAALVVFPMIGGLGYRNYETCFRDMEAIFPNMNLGVENNYDIYFVSDAPNLAEVSPAKPVKIRYAYGEMGDDMKVNLNALRDGEKILTIDQVAPKFKDKNYLFLDTVRDCSIGKEATASGGGSGFVFVGFTEAVTHIWGSNLFSVLFFIMLFLLGIDSGFGTVEGAVAAFEDLTGTSRAIATSCVCSVLMVLALLVFPFGFGSHVLDVIDTYTANWTLLAVALFECIAVAWVYGLAKIAYDVHLMTGSKPNLYILLCWKYITPAVLVTLLVGSVVQFITTPGTTDYKVFAPKDLKSVGGQVSKPLPFYSVATGFGLMFFCMIWIPIHAILRKTRFRLLPEQGLGDFPEEELRAERNINVDKEEDQFTDTEKAIMSRRSIQNLQDHRDQTRSQTSIHKKKASGSSSSGNVSLSGQ